MSTDEDAIKRRYREYLDLLPLTLAIAGLPENQTHRNLTTEQMETRVQNLETAFKLARVAVREAVKSG